MDQQGCDDAIALLREIADLERDDDGARPQPAHSVRQRSGDRRSGFEGKTRDLQPKPGACHRAERHLRTIG
jgi:hypothetical protein